MVGGVALAGRGRKGPAAWETKKERRGGGVDFLLRPSPLFSLSLLSFFSGDGGEGRRTNSHAPGVSRVGGEVCRAGGRHGCVLWGTAVKEVEQGREERGSLARAC